MIDLGNQYLQGSFIKPGKETPPKRKISTEIFRCNPMLDENACGLLQTSISVPPEILYSSYWYRSGTNQTMRDHLEGIANVAKLLISKDDASVLDIGCNDGTLLSNYNSKNLFGFDPSNAILEMSEEDFTAKSNHKNYLKKYALRKLIES